MSHWYMYQLISHLLLNISWIMIIIKEQSSVAIYCFQLSYIIRPDRIVIQPRNKKMIFFIDIFETGYLIARTR